MASKGNNCSLSIQLSARPRDTTSRANLWPRPFRIASTIRGLRALRSCPLGDRATGSLSLCIFVLSLSFSISLFFFLLLSSLLLLLFLSDLRFSWLRPRREEDWIDRYYYYYFYFSWLRSRREEDWTDRYYYYYFYFSWLRPRREEEEKDRSMKDRGGAGKSSIVVIIIIIFTFLGSD